MGLVGFISWIIFEGNFFLTDEHLLLIIADSSWRLMFFCDLILELVCVWL